MEAADGATGGRARPRRRARWLVALAAAIAALGAAEVVARIAVPSLGERGFRDPGLGWSTSEYRAFDPARHPPEEGRTRVLVLGDSFLAGAGLSALERRFSSVLQELAPELDVQVFASGGWGTDQQLLAFLERGRAWRPQVVVLAFCANNDLDNLLTIRSKQGVPKPYYVLGEKGELALFDAEGRRIEHPAPRPSGAVGFQSYLVDLVRLRVLQDPVREVDRATDPPLPYNQELPVPIELVEPVARLGPRLEWSPQALDRLSMSAYIAEDFERNAYQWRLVEAILAELDRQVRDAGGELVLMLLPQIYAPQDARFLIGAGLEHRFETPTGSFTFRSDEPRDRLRAITERTGVTFFDPTGEFLELAREPRAFESFWPSEVDRHFADPAHRALGEMLHRWLRDELGAIE